MIFRFHKTGTSMAIILTTVSVVVAAVTAFSAPAKAVVAFNTFPISYTSQLNHDLPMIDARDVTSGGTFSTSQADHDNGVPANAGDTIEFQIYYHNSGVAEDVATNVIVKASLPSGTSQSHTVSATISSDQTAPVSSSDPNRGGNIAVNINGTPQTLTFVPGSVQWFPNHSTTQQTLANSDSLVTSGVNIGSVQGCFQFSGFLTFLAKVGTTIVTSQNLSITKSVLNVTAGQTSYQSSVNANPGDDVRFQIQFSTSGNSNQTNVILQDNLPSQLSFSSIQVDGQLAVGGNLGLFGSGINFGTLSPNTTHTVVFDAFVAGQSSFSGSTTLTNTANVRSDQVGTQQASASVFVQVQGQNQNLSITKSVLNITAGQTSYQSSVNANPGDRVRFQVQFNTSGNTNQTNVIARDLLPSQLIFASGTLRLDSVNVINEADFFGGGINFGTQSPGSSHTLTFEATVAGAGSFSNNNITLTNTANVRSDQVFTQQASASVFVQLVLGVQFSLRKTAFNLTQGVDATSVPANPGDIITYTLYYKNTGQTTISGATIVDDITDIEELAQVVDQGGAVSVNGAIHYAPIDVPSGVEISRSFRVKVIDASLFPANSDLVMTNIYGNTVNVVVRKPQVFGVITPPRTGAGETIPLVFAGLSTVGFWFWRKRATFQFFGTR